MAATPPPVYKNPVPKLKDIDSYNYSFIDADNTYLYGFKDGNARRYLYRVPLSINSYRASVDITSEAYDFGANVDVISVNCTSVEGEIFVVTLNQTSSKYQLHRSDDYGDSFTQVMLLGDTDGTVGNQITNVGVENNRCFCEATINGVRTYFLGEYNINVTRTNGSTNDQNRLMKSTDGVNWTAEMTWNTDGSNNNIRHIHTVIQDPYTNNIFIACGDTNAQSGLIIWDGVSAWTDNLNHADLANESGFVVYYGQQRNRVLDILFTQDYFYATADADADASEAGIWRGLRDGSQYIRVGGFHVGTGTPNKIMWRGVQLNGVMIFTDGITNDPGSDYEIGMYTSYENVVDFQKTARFGLVDGTAGCFMQGMFVKNNKIYYSPQLTHAAGKSNAVTVVMELDGDFDYPYPKTVYPNYWVDPDNGTDSTATGEGRFPDHPWASIEYALEANAMTEGGVLHVPAKTINESNIIPVYNSRLTLPGESGKPVTIRGEGKDVSKWVFSSGSGFGVQFTSAANMNLEDIHYYCTVSGGDCFFNANTVQVDFNLVDAHVGDNGVSNRTFRHRSGILKAYRSIIEAPKAASSSKIGYEQDHASGDTEIHLYEGSHLKGGWYPLDISNLCDVYIRNSYITDFYNRAMFFNGASYNVGSDLDIKQSIIWSDQGAGLFDEGGASPVYSNIQNNYLNNTETGLGDGNYISNPIQTDPFTDYANDDLSLNATAKANLRGTGVKWWTGANPLDLNGVPIPDLDIDAGTVQQIEDHSFTPDKL